MTAITQCPACGTLFRVVEDQLRISQGWVRCGQCHQVFDAQLALRSEAEIHTAESTGGLVQSTDALTDADLSQTVEPVSTPTAIGVEPTTSETVLEDLPTAEVDPKPSLHPDMPLDLQAMPAVSFIQAKPPEASRLASWLWGFVAVVFALVLAGQLVWQQRSLIAAHHPALAGPIEQACAFAGCTLEPLRSVDSIVIDSFAVTEIGAAGYRLTFNLRSNAPTPIAAPSVELSLQDAQEQTVLKRVFTPAEFGLLRASMASNSEHAANLIFTLREPNGSPVKRISGYRLFAFYP